MYVHIVYRQIECVYIPYNITPVQLCTEDTVLCMGMQEWYDLV